VDASHQQIVASIDPAERRRVLWEAQRYLIQEMTYVQPWPREEALIAYRTRVKGLAVPSAQVHYLNDMGSTWIDGN
jgi:ABC-type transport system substrate-binding protein